MNESSHLFLAKRENDPLPDLVVVNTRQCKHIPGDPVSAIELMEELGRKLAQDGRAEKPTVIIALAETAAAIGAVVSGFFHDCFFVTTTREKLPDWATVIALSEQYSHAPQHYLCVRDEDIFRSAAQVIIVDDEFTTGRTALDLIRALDGCLAPRCAVYAAALSATRESSETFRSAGITPVCLASSDNIADFSAPGGPIPDRDISPREPDRISYVNSIYDPRLGVRADSYLAEVSSFCSRIAGDVSADGMIEVIGTEEFCYPALLLGKMLAEQRSVVVHCSTRSPMLPFGGTRDGSAEHSCGEYPIASRAAFHSTYAPEHHAYLYNSRPCALSVILTDAYPLAPAALSELCGAAGGKSVQVIYWHGKKLPTSYLPEDVELLLTDVTGKLQPLSASEREPLIQNGIHYSELLPAEHRPTDAYFREYENGLRLWARHTADAVRTVAETIWSEKGRRAVLVSFTRAGTPSGVLIKRYIRKKYGVSLPHYSVSMIPGRGIDRRAMEYILARHPAESIQFIDGWTGKGMITRTLRSALEQFPLYEYGVGRDKMERLCEVAVLADPAGMCRLCGTHSDIFIPSACLNSIVSGLFSRTVLKSGVIQPDEFHGAAFFKELEPLDRTYGFISAIESKLTYGEAQLPPPASGNGLYETRQIAQEFGIADIGLVKPGIGETTRILLRRIPELILLRDPESPLTRHIAELAREKGVEVRQYPLKCYEACGIIKAMDNV